MKAAFVFLGTGASSGVPQIGCKCPVCSSEDPHNKRLRPSGLLTINDQKFLIDVGPDFRQQALTNNIDDVDGLLLTHVHYDHIGGIDDLRIFNFKKTKPLPCLLSKESFEEIQKRYDYFFRKQNLQTSLSAQFDFHVLDKDFGVVEFLGIRISYFTFYQGKEKITGYRIGNFAYVTDIRHFTDEIFLHLKGVDLLVLSAVWPSPSPVHFSVPEAVAFAEKVGAKKTYFTHVAHELDHNVTNLSLPEGIEMAYDGLSLEFFCKET